MELTLSAPVFFIANKSEKNIGNAAQFNFGKDNIAT